MYFFCTCFDQHYLSRGLALHASLIAHCPGFKLWVVCLDAECLDILSRMRLKNTELIPLSEVERADEGLRQAKSGRSRIEYYFTCTPSILLHLLTRRPEADLLTYLDADLFFFSDPAPIYEEMGARSIGIFGHRFSEHHRSREQYGIYNVGWLSFRKDGNSLDCLRWWRERCLEWCFDRVEEGRFADQKYLDEWPGRFQGVAVLDHKGAGLAPWNMENYSLRRQDGKIFVDGAELVFFHFHGFKVIVDGWLYNPNMASYGVRASSLFRRRVCLPYVRAILAAGRRIAPFGNGAAGRNGIRPAPSAFPARGGRWWDRLDSFARIGYHVAKGDYVVVLRGAGRTRAGQSGNAASHAGGGP